jgi:hypothetical protein
MSSQVQQSPTVNCPACADKRVHRELEWSKYHQNAGTGHSIYQGDKAKTIAKVQE